jgi:serine protease Do
MPSLLQQLNADMADVVDGVHKVLVQIHNGERGIGAGTVWHAQGLILTNNHVIDGRYGASHQLAVTLPDQRELPAKVISNDPTRDIAALMIEADDLPTIELGDSKALQPGSVVFALGHPWGIANAVTAGVVIGVHPPPEFNMVHDDWVAVSLHMRPGYSGGPLVDENGRLVGLNTFITGPDVGYAVPVHVVKQFLRETIGSGVAA